MLAAKVDGQEQHLILGSRHGRRILKVSVLCHLLLICFPLFKSPISLKESVPRCLAVVGPDKSWLHHCLTFYSVHSEYGKKKNTSKKLKMRLRQEKDSRRRNSAVRGLPTEPEIEKIKLRSKWRKCSHIHKHTQNKNKMKIKLTNNVD